MTLLAVPLAGVLVLDASAEEMGLLTAAGLVPHLLFSLGVGAWLDRRGRRRAVMIWADVGRALLLATIPLAHVVGTLGMAQLYAVAFLAGTLTVFFEVAYATLFVAIVPREQFVDANGLLHRSRALSWVAGPGITGALVELLTAPFAILADAFTFLASALFLRGVDAREPPVDEAEGAGLVRRLGAGLSFVGTSVVYRASLAATATINFFNFMFHALFVLFAARELDVAPGALGAILAVGGIGALLGSFVAPGIGRRIGVGPAYVGGCLVFPLPLVLVPLAAGPDLLVYAMLGAAEFLAGIGVMVLDVNGNAINLAVIPERIRARVTGAHRFVNYGVRPLGSLAGGFLGGAIGLRPTLWIATAGAVAGVLWLLPSPIPRLRELPDPEG